MCLVLVLVFLFGLGLFVISNQKQPEFAVVTTNFPAYDFARAIVGEENVKLIVPPGSDLHDFEPTPSDIKAIKKADLLIYNGGESETWLQEIHSLPKNTIRMLDLVEPITLTEHGHAEVDEHIWTDSKNAELILSEIAKTASKIWPQKSTEFQANLAEYTAKITEKDQLIADLVDNSKRKTLVVGDRFPLNYFVKAYHLDYDAAFSSCGHETEPDAKTIAKLIDKVKAQKIPVVLKLELSNGKVAETIAKATGAKVMEFNSYHNISADDFEKGVTYVDLMQKNYEVLQEALK